MIIDNFNRLIICIIPMMFNVICIMLAALGIAQASLALLSLAQHFRNGSELKLHNWTHIGIN